MGVTLKILADYINPLTFAPGQVSATRSLLTPSGPEGSSGRRLIGAMLILPFFLPMLAPPYPEFPVLRTRRLLMRDIREEDARRIFDMRSNGRVNQFIARENMQEEESAGILVQKTRKAYKDGLAIGWAGILRDEGSIIGTCGFNRIELFNQRAEIGGEMATEFWGKHLAVEAVAAILHFGFETMKLHSVEAKVNPDNRGAIALMEHLGFRKEAHFREYFQFRGEWQDLAVYAVLDGEFRCPPGILG